MRVWATRFPGRVIVDVSRQNNMDAKEHIQEIRSHIDAIEATVASGEGSTDVRNWDALELPDVIAAIVDYLQPQLTTYEAVLYWHLFRKSLLGNGTQHVRVSVRGLQKGVAISSSGQSTDFSYNAVQTNLSGLEEKGVVSKSGDTNRDGTLYKVLLPDEIPICADYRHEQTEVEPIPVNLKSELDFYNVRDNRIKVFERDDYQCHYCQKQLTRFSATLDHIQPVSKGGDNSYNNLVTACLHCNSRRGNRPVMDAIIRGQPDG